jgi:hypothetical protein
MSRARRALILTAIFALALGVRAWAALVPGRLISRDGIRYARLGRTIAEGRLRAALEDDYAPGYPFAIALAGRAIGARSDFDYARAGVWASALVGALAVLPAWALGRRAAGVPGAALAALLLALEARHVVVSADALSEALFFSLALGSIAAALRAATEGGPKAAAASGALAAAAFLVRPEGIVLLAAAPVVLARRKGRAARALAIALPFVVLALPYVECLSERAGTLVISQKKWPSALFRAAVEDPSRVLRNAIGNLGRAFEAGPVVMAAALVGAIVSIRPQGAGRLAGSPDESSIVDRRSSPMALALSSVLFGALLATYSLVRADKRFGLGLTVVALAAAAVGAAAVARRSALFAGALVLVSAAEIPLVSREQKPHYLACARAIAEEARREGLPRPRVAAYDARIAFYAGAEGVPESAAEADFRVLDPAAVPAGAEALGRFDPPRGTTGRALVLCRARRP